MSCTFTINHLFTTDTNTDGDEERVAHHVDIYVCLTGHPAVPDIDLIIRMDRAYYNEYDDDDDLISCSPSQVWVVKINSNQQENILGHLWTLSKSFNINFDWNNSDPLEELDSLIKQEVFSNIVSRLEHYTNLKALLNYVSSDLNPVVTQHSIGG
jgi:hypothetical protein